MSMRMKRLMIPAMDSNLPYASPFQKGKSCVIFWYYIFDVELLFEHIIKLMFYILLVAVFIVFIVVLAASFMVDRLSANSDV